MHSIIRIAIAISAAALLAACGGSGNDDDDDGGAATLQQGFGANFAAAFDGTGTGGSGGGGGADDGEPGGVAGAVDVTAEPNSVTAGDIIAVSFTTDPDDIPNP